MKRHQCRHCGQVLDTYATLKRHLASHATPAVIEHTYSVAPPLDVPREVPREVPPSEQAKRTKYSCKCDATFDIWDDLQDHVRSVCRLSSSRSRSRSSSSNRKQTTVYTCAKCGMTYNKRVNLTRHVRNECTADDDDTTPPSPKISFREDTTPNHPLVTDADPIDPPARLPFADNLSPELLDVVRAHWSTIRTRVTRGPLQCRYDYRVTTLDTTVLEPSLRNVFQEQTNAFKINLSYGFVLRNKNTGQYKYYHPSCNCCGRYLDEPSLITNSKDFDKFLERIRETDVLQWAINQRPDSSWVCELVTNVTFFVNRIIDHPIGCVGMTDLPMYIKRNKAVIALDTEPQYSKRYNDNLCLFRCLALHRGCERRRLEPAVETLYATYAQDGVPMAAFAGVTMDDLYRVETTFETNVCVYRLVKPDGDEAEEEDGGKSTAELVRRSVCKYPDTLYLNLHGTHYSYIQDRRKYCHSYRCRKCGDSLWKDAWHLRNHESTCTGGVRRVYPGGVYHSTPSVFERLADENIRVAEALQYYPYRATFDFECWFDTEHLPANSARVHWVARHVPLSVSVASNVPGHEQVTCIVTDGDVNKLVSTMMTVLQAMSEAAYDKIKDSYDHVLEQLAEEVTKWDAREEAARDAAAREAGEKKGRAATNPYKTLMGQMYGWMRQLPVVGFNSGKYDLNAIKQFLIPYFLTTSKTDVEQDEAADEREQEGNRKVETDGIGSMFVIKRNNTFMCLTTDQLKFVDMINYIAPGFSYDKYLKAYGCEVTKGHFPYEYMDRLERLDDTTLPPKEAFFSRLKNEGISDEDYASCQEAWRVNGMTTLRDFLVWYNNRDVVPFLQAIDRQFAFYRQRGIDMFKHGISVPGLTLRYLFNDLPEKTYFTNFNEKNKDLHDLVKANIVGGPSIIFHSLSRERGHHATSERVRRGGSSLSSDRRIRCERTVPVVAHAGHAYGMVHATTSGEGLPPRIGAAVRTDGRRMVDVGIRTHGTVHTASDQRTREAHRQTSGGRMVQRDEDGLSVPRLLFSRLLVQPRGGERRQRETHGATARRDPKDHRLPTTLCHGRRVVGMRVEGDETNTGRTQVCGCSISPTSTRAMDDDVTTDPERSACRNRVRHDRVRRTRTGSVARALCRDAARVQEHWYATGGSRSVHAPIRRRARHNEDSASHARG